MDAISFFKACFYVRNMYATNVVRIAVADSSLPLPTRRRSRCPNLSFEDLDNRDEEEQKRSKRAHTHTVKNKVKYVPICNTYMINDMLNFPC